MKILFPLFVSVLISSAFANAPSQVINGSGTLRDAHFDTVQVNGSLTFEKISIDQSLKVNGFLTGKGLECDDLKINGSTDIQNVKANSLEINGSLSCENVHVQNVFSIYGKLTAKNFFVEDKCTIHGNFHIDKGTIAALSTSCMEGTLSGCTVGQIDVRKNKKNFNFFGFSTEISSRQILELKNGTVVSGNIEFESEGGEVHLFDTSRVQGKVLRGKIIQK